VAGGEFQVTREGRVCRSMGASAGAQVAAEITAGDNIPGLLARTCSEWLQIVQARLEGFMWFHGYPWHSRLLALDMGPAAAVQPGGMDMRRRLSGAAAVAGQGSHEF
jgi:hypothetical protein